MQIVPHCATIGCTSSPTVAMRLCISELPAVPLPRAGRFVRNSLAVLGTQTIARVAALVAFLLVARSLTIEALGTYALTLAAIELLRPFADLGLSGATVRFLAGVPREGWRAVVMTSLRLRLLALLAMCLLLALLLTLPALAAYRDAARFAAVAVTCSAVAGAFTAPFQAALRMERVALVQGLGALVHLAGVVVGARLGWSAPQFMAWLVAQDGLIALGVWHQYGRDFGGGRARTGPTDLPRHLWRDGLPLGAIAALSLAYFRIDVLMLEGWVGPAAVGQYGIAYRACEALLLVQIAISVSAYPRYAAMSRADADGGRMLFGVLSRLLISIGTFLALGLVLFAPIVLPSLVPRAAASVPLIAVLAWAVALTFANAAIVDRLLAARVTLPVLGVAAANLIMNIVLNRFLIPEHGALGAAIATVATEATGALLLVAVLFWRNREAPPLDAWALIVGAATAHLLVASGHWRLAVLPAAIALMATATLGRRLAPQLRSGEA